MGGPRTATVLTVLIIAVAAVLVLAAPAGTQIRKPTNANDSQDATINDNTAFDDQDGYDQSTFATTTQPDANPSITFDQWNTTDTKVYEALSLTITINASGFTDDSWNYYFDNSTDTTCDDTDWFLAGTGGTLFPDNLGITNVSVTLPRKQDLSDIAVCLTGAVTLTGDGGQVSTFDIRTNGTLDTDPPLWQNMQQNDSTPVQGDAVELAAQGFDNLNLSHAVLATNETGTFQNTSVYGSPQQVYVGGTAVWTNFTWRNASLNAGTTVGWRIWYNDTSGNVNATDVGTFTLEDAFLAVTLIDPPAPLAAIQNTTFLLNATATCTWGDCGNVTGTARYNQSTDPDTQIPQFTGKPFHTTRKENPLNCATFLNRGERCNVTWHVNATGPVGSIHRLDVNLTSNRTVWNATDPQEVEIVAAAIEMVLRFTTVDFGNLFVGTTDNPAENNSDRAYNISITASSGSDADVWLNGTDMLQEDGNRRIGVGNVSWNATADDRDNTAPLGDDPTRIASGIAPGTNVTTFYWLNVPFGLYHDNYTGTLTVTANETQ